MATQQAGTTINYIAGGTITQYAAVKIDATLGLIVTSGVASEDNTFVGVAQQAAVSGAVVPVTLYGTGTLKCKATAAIAKYAKVYTMADGDVDDVATSLTVVGVAMEAATAADDIIEVSPIAGADDDIS